MPVSQRPRRPYRHRGSQFTAGPRSPLTRNERAMWRARVQQARRARLLTPGQEHAALALVKRLGVDGRCDPAYETIGEDSATSERTARRAVERLVALGMLHVTRRMVRVGQWGCTQTSNAYQLLITTAEKFAEKFSDGQSGRETCFMFNKHKTIRGVARFSRHCRSSRRQSGRLHGQQWLKSRPSGMQNGPLSGTSGANKMPLTELHWLKNGS